MLLALVTACDSSPPPAPKATPPPTTKEAPVGEVSRRTARPAAPAVPVPTLSGRVFVDVSTSMGGFVGRRAKKTGLRELHRLIDLAMAEAGATAPARCNLGAAPVCARWAEQDAGPKKCVAWTYTKPVACPARRPDYGRPALYRAPASGLSAVLVKVPVPATIDPDHPPAVDLIDEAKLTVFVLSGLEPGPARAMEGVSAAETCLAGASPACVAAAVLERARAGYGVWLVTALLGFDGRYVADVPVDRRYPAAVREHLRSVEQVAPGEVAQFSGVDLKIGAQRRVRGRPANFSGFAYRGVRPVLLLVLARDPAMGRRFVRSLTERVSGDAAMAPGTMDPASLLRSVELAPLPLPAFRLQPPAKAPPGPGGQGSLDPAFVQEFDLRQTGTDKQGAWAKVTCGTRGKAWLTVGLDTATGPASLPSYLKAETLMRGPKGDEPLPSKVGVVQPFARGAFRVYTACGPLAVRPKPWTLRYGLRRKMVLDKTAAAQAWWAEQSAPNSYEMPERVYGLSDVVQTLLNEATIADVGQGQLRVEVTRIE